MILRSNIRGNGSQLADYLLKRKSDQQVHVFAIRGTSQSRDLKKSLIEMNLGVEISGRTKKGLYQVIISPPQEESQTMTEVDWKRCVEIIEEIRGFSEQPRVMVFHDNGRKHLHVIWSRTSYETGKVISNKYSHYGEKRARIQIEKELGLSRTNETNLERPALKKLLAELWSKNPNGKDFIHAVKKGGYVIAAQQGRRPYAIVNASGRSFELVKEIPNAKTKQLREKLKGLHLPDKNELIAGIR